MKSRPRLTESQTQRYGKLLQKKYRRTEGMFLVEGKHLVEEALSSEWEVEAVILGDEAAATRHGAALERSAERRGARIFGASPRSVKRLSETTTAQGILAAVRMNRSDPVSVWKTEVPESVAVGLESVADPGNVGTIIRTCDWFGVRAVMLDEASVELYNPKVVRATQGSLFHLPVITECSLPECVGMAKKNGFTVYATALSGGKPLFSEALAQKSFIVFGNEARGVSPRIMQMADHLLTIPKFGKAESLNIASSCSIILAAATLARAPVR